MQWDCPILRLALAAMGLLGLVSPAWAGSGGPDAAGYVWFDSDSGRTDLSVPQIDPLLLQFRLLTNERVVPVSLPFEFGYYGIKTSTVFLSDNGWMAFSPTPLPVPVSQDMPDPTTPNHLLSFLWRDFLQFSNQGTLEYGPSLTNDSFVFHLDLDRNIVGLGMEVWVVLHDDNHIKVVYGLLDSPTNGAVGTEDALGAVGLGLSYLGTTAPGFAPRSDYAFEIVPSPLLDCGRAAPIACGESVRFTGPPTPSTPNAGLYSCVSGASYEGNEVVYALRLTATSDVVASIDDLGGRDLDVFLLDAECNEHNGCLAGGSDLAGARFLSPGTYYVVVDGLDPGDDGDFRLQLSCVELTTPTACGAFQVGSTSGESLVNLYDCMPALLAGPEAIYEVSVPAGTPKLEAELLSGPPGAKVLIAPEDFEPVGNPTCLAAGDRVASVFAPPEGTYYVIVDAPGAGLHEVSTVCSSELDCSAAPIHCGQTVSDTTSGGPDLVNGYSCREGDFSGPEVVYVFDNPLPQQLNLDLRSGVAGLEVLLLEACDEGSCRMGSAAGGTCLDLPAGRYYVVVDGADAAEGAFELSAGCSALAPGMDLLPANLDVSELALDLGTLEASGSVAFDVYNLGQSRVSGPFAAVVFEDRDGSGGWSGPANDNLLGQTTLPGPVEPGIPVPVAVPVSGTMLFRDNWVWAAVDSADVVAEASETNNLAESGASCLHPPDPGHFDAKVEWVWDENSKWPGYHHVDMTPIVLNLTDDNRDGRVDEDDVPDVAFLAGTLGAGFSEAVLVAVDGATGQTHWVTSPAIPLFSSDHLAAGDIDQDGLPEIVGIQVTDLTVNLVAFEHTGTLKWVSDPATTEDRVGGGAPALADMDLDGIPEVIYGHDIFDASGRLLCSGTAGRGGPILTRFGPIAPISTVADLDLDGIPEIVAGNTAYRNDCSIYWANPLIADGFPAVANLDGDPFPEVVVVASDRVHLLNHDGTLVWTATPGTSGGGPPTISDVDNDCLPEIGVAFNQAYLLFDAEGSERWRAPSNENSSGITGSSVFDFDGDGLEEIVYNDERALRVFSGLDGTLLWSMANSSHTWTENPVIADVDRDQRAEVIVPSNSSVISAGSQGVRSVGEPTWVNTRRLWNQHSYHITNVENSAAVPAEEAPNWDTYNNFRTQVGGAILDDPDATAARLVPECLPDGSLLVSLRVGSAGHVEVPGDLKVTLYDGDPASGGVPLTTLDLPGPFVPQSFFDVETILPPPLPPAGSLLYAVVDDPEAYGECDELNNIVWAEHPDCRVCAATLTASADAAICEGESVRLSAVGAAEPCDGPVEYRWLESGTPVSAWSFTSTLNVSPAATTLYTVEARCTAEPDCQAADEVLVNVAPYPQVEAGPDADLCLGQSHVLDGSSSSHPDCPAGLEYRWWEGGSPLGSWSPSPLAPVTPTASTSYRLEVRCASAPECVSSDSLTLVPFPPPVPDAGPDREECVHEQITIAGSASTAPPCDEVVYRWRQGASVLRDWGPDPDLSLVVSNTVILTLEVRCVDNTDCLGSDAMLLVADPCATAVSWAHYGATREDSGVRVSWATGMEVDSFGFEVWARDALGTSWKLPSLVAATGPGSHYELLDGSPEALSGGFMAYRVVEVSFAGPGDVTPWFEVSQATRGGRHRGGARR